MTPRTSEPRAQRRNPTLVLLVGSLLTLFGVSCKSQETKQAARPVPSEVEPPRNEQPSPPPTAPPRAEQPSRSQKSRPWSFEDTEVESLPQAWSAPAGEWRVEIAQQAPSGSRVLAQKASNGSPVFNLALADAPLHADVEITVQLRAMRGRIDRGGGVVWRAKDANNYYVARYNPLEDNYRVYTVKEGRRQELASANVELDPQAWHTLRVKMRADHIECFLDDQKYLDVRDGTFPAAGRMGLWTKADAVTQFDALAVEGLERTDVDAAAIGRIIETEATTTGDGVVRVRWSRSDVPVSIDGMRFPPAAGLTSWAGFTSTPNTTMVMGDTVVFQDEVSPAMDAAFAGGLEISALHNHFFYDEPRVYFMHIGGHGDAQALARGVKAVWDAIREVRRRRPDPASGFSNETPSVGGSLDAAAIGRIIGVEPSVNGDVVKVTVDREATMHNKRFSGSMGLTTWVAFTGSDGLSAIDGDFAMTASEVQPVLQALRRAGIHVVALHNHMIGEGPPYYFTHFWATGPAAGLARGVRAALDVQREVRGGSRH